MSLEQGTSEIQRIVIETKVLRGTRKKTIAQGVEQTWGYMDRANAQEGHLILFDHSQRAWSEKIFSQIEHHQGIAIKVWGM